MFFKPFPKITYLFNIAGKDELHVVRDIILNVRFRKQVLSRIELFDDYTISDRETPELISEKLYGNPLYHWTIMLVNEKFDHIEDFPMTEEAVFTYTYNKYKNDVTRFYPSYHENMADFTYRIHKAFDGEDRDTVLYRFVEVDGSPLWRDADGNDVASSTFGAHQVTNIEYEISERRIKYGDEALIEAEYIMRSPKILYGEPAYVTPDGEYCNRLTPWAMILSNHEFEKRANEAKRKIRVINPSIINQVTEEIYGMFEAYNGDV